MNNRPNLPKNPLRRDGVSQRQRLTPALSPDATHAAQVDERELADFLVLAHRLSEHVHYYKVCGTQPSNSSSNRATSKVSAHPLASWHDGNWRDFFVDYTPVQIALISKTRPQAVRRNYDNLFNLFLERPNCKTLIPILTFWQTSILIPIQIWYETLEIRTPFRATIKGLVNTNLGDSINQIIVLEQTCEPEKMNARSALLALWWTWFVILQRDRTTNASINPTLIDCWFASLVYALIPNIAFYGVFTELFQLPPVPDPGVPFATGSRVSVEADLHSEIDGIFQDLFQVFRQIILQAPTFLDTSLSDRRDHPPHLAMYVAMLDVLQPARDDLNRMTQRHLDFFYRQVLNLPARPATPDYVHLLFELAKPQREYRLVAGTRFKAGKDAMGVELFYALDQDMVVHKATIASLKGLFLDSKQFSDQFSDQVPTDIVQLLESPIANSADGQGGDFPKDQVVQAWLPFGGPRVPTSQTTQMERSQLLQGSPAQLGVAIASDVLLLQEGVRTITLALSLGDVFQDLEPVKEALKQSFEIYLSGEKEWIKAASKTSLDDESPAFIKSVTWNGSNSTLTIGVELPAEVEPVLPYDLEKPIPFDPDVPNLPLTLERSMPVLRIQLTTRAIDSEGRSIYHYLRGVRLTDLTITTDVSEVRNLVVQTDAGVQDATKPFQPFGPRPKAGSTLYIGSQEVFQKPLTKLTIGIEWDELPEGGNFVKHYRGYYLNGEQVVTTLDEDMAKAPAYFENFSATVSRRTKRTWSDDGIQTPYKLFDPLVNPPEQQTLIERNGSQEPLPGELLEPFTTFTPETTGGFLQFVLDRSFLHDEFPTKFATQTLAAAKNFQANDFVNNAVYEIAGASPTLQRYSIQTSGSFPENNNTEDPPITVAPITIKEPYTPTIRSLALGYTAQAKLADVQLFQLHPFGGFEAISEDAPYPLFPQFTNEGELLIGIADLDPPTALPLLFQVAEETADTGLRRTEEFKPMWFYLKDNSWESLGDRISSDTTNGLIRSGIVNLGIPEDISKAKTTILDPTLHWIKVSMPARSRTVCHIIGVHPQAARVTFMDSGNDPSHLAQPLPAGSIAKLEKPQAAIKGIEQPYASVDGRVQEPPSQFYTRVSEHLRHKGRAVTIFDYERLVLEQFPDIYKVRCLNHGQFDDGTNELFELAPGAVTMAVIPDLAQRSTTDDLQPKVNINRLQAIEAYLTSLSSSWATVKVVNPQYEPIRVSFEVKFRSPFAANFGYYRRELERAIVGFLTPWTVDQGADIHFGGKVYRSAILNFVEEQEYVDYVVNFTMFHNKQTNVREAIASTARSVLTSVPYDNSTMGHIITEHKEQALAPNVPLKPGILGYEVLDNLIIGPDPEESGNE
ncbi:MAG: hypothetical protein AAGD25_00025 [Cyanobacteria bacterium P01_F01_bin.150]